jgi:GNAT superfamily N-acetyltransferase
MPARLSPAPSRAASLSIVPAAARDLPFVVAMQKQHASALGFIPRMALGEKIARQQIWLARVGGKPAGFLHHGSLARPEVRIFQAAVCPAVRRKRLGIALVNDLLRRAAGAGAKGVSLRCLETLDANAFWRAAGFRRLATEPGGKGTLNVWVKRLGAHPGRFGFASRVHACPGCGTPTVDTWVRGARRLSLCEGCVAAAGLN